MGISLPLTGLMPLTPSTTTPVFSLFSSVRSKSDLRAPPPDRRRRVGVRIRPASTHFDEGVLGADDHVGRAEQRVRAGGVDRQGVARGGVKLISAPWLRPIQLRCWS